MRVCACCVVLCACVCVHTHVCLCVLLCLCVRACMHAEHACMHGCMHVWCARNTILCLYISYFFGFNVYICMDFVKCSVFTLVVERHGATETTTIIIIVLFH